MKYSSSIQLLPALLAAATLVHAQSAPDFPVQVQTNLRVEFQSERTDVTAGALMQREDLLEPPTVQGPIGNTRTLTFMLFMIDQDVASKSGQPGQLLHFFEPNLSGASEVLFADSSVPNSTDASRVNYIPPTPPEGDGPHRYTLLLYRQPKGFQIPNSFSSFFPPADNSARAGFDMAGFAQAAGLGNPVSGNWFRVQNGDVVASSAASSPSSATQVATTNTASKPVATISNPESTSTRNTALTFTIITTCAATASASVPESAEVSPSSEETVPAETSFTDAFTISTLTPTDSPAATSAPAATVDTTPQPSSAQATAAASSGTRSSPIAPGGSSASGIFARDSLGCLVAALILGIVAGVEFVVW